MKAQSAAKGMRTTWRHAAFLAVVLAPLLLVASLPPIAQDPAYHDFADRRALLGIPNFADVVSSLPFLLVGLAGLKRCMKLRAERCGHAWHAFFAGVALVGLGSAYYHWSPNNATLVWDRLPMAIGFASLFSAIVADYVNRRLGNILLAPMIAIALGSVVLGHGYDDLRLYVWVQALPLLAIPAALVYPPAFSHRGHLVGALGFYVLAKLAELYDRPLFSLTDHLIGGHALKHVLGACAVWVLLDMLNARRALKPNALDGSPS